LAYSLLSISGFILFHYFADIKYCQSEGGYYGTIPEPRRPLWCQNSIIPGYKLYSYVQDHYWFILFFLSFFLSFFFSFSFLSSFHPLKSLIRNVGFLRYYEVKQIPNFLLATPMIILSVYGIYTYFNYDRNRFLSLGLISSKETHQGKKKKKENGLFFTKTILPFIYLWVFLLVYLVPTIHIQVITRLFSSLPPIYWTITFTLYNSPKMFSFFIHYFVLYTLIGIVLYSNFYPPA